MIGVATSCANVEKTTVGGLEMEQLKPTNESRKLVWADEFDQSSIDRTKWTFELGNGFSDANGNWVAGWGNNEKEYYTDRSDNVRVEEEKLRITAKKETVEGFEYTSARLSTKGLFSQTYGRFEIRAKLPAGKGLWPAIWMLPEDNRYGGWAASGEIDIMEAKGSHSGGVSGALHFGGSWPNNTYVDSKYNFPDGSTIEAFHVYAVEWEPEVIRWYVDGELYQTQTHWYSGSLKGEEGNPPYPAPFDQPFHLLINLAVGGNFDGDPDVTVKFPAVMEIDYVRVYE
jgi:beta-glucanase (GH16 family)